MWGEQVGDGSQIHIGAAMNQHKTVLQNLSNHLYYRFSLSVGNEKEDRSAWDNNNFPFSQNSFFNQSGYKIKHFLLNELVPIVLQIVLNNKTWFRPKQFFCKHVLKFKINYINIVFNIQYIILKSTYSIPNISRSNIY